MVIKGAQGAGEAQQSSPSEATQQLPVKPKVDLQQEGQETTWIMPNNLLLVDVQGRNEEAYQALVAQQSLLLARKERLGVLFPEVEKQLLEKLTKQVQAYDVYKPSPGKPPPTHTLMIDPLWVGLRDIMTLMLPGLTPAGPEQPTEPAAEKTFNAVFGLLLLDRIDSANEDRFARAVPKAMGEYTAKKGLFDAVLPLLRKLATPPAEGKPDPVKAEEWAAVTRALASQGIKEDDRYLEARVEAAQINLLGADGNAPPSGIDIDLPDLEEDTAVDIVVENLYAMQALYFASQLEEARLFQVVDRLVALFEAGTLPLGRTVNGSAAGNMLYTYWKNSSDRMSEIERRNLYARAFGMVGGDASQPSPNREFSDLWLRFVSAVCTYINQLSVDRIMRVRDGLLISQEQVRKSGRDLAANLSLHGYGMAYWAAVELQKTIKDHLELLRNAEIRAAWGAQDSWQVIEQVSALELGGQRNTMRYKTMADSGAIIIRWLADRSDKLSGPPSAALLNVDEITSQLPQSDHNPKKNPTDTDLVNACYQWLAVTGTTDQRIVEYSQASEGPNIPSRPIQVPAVARDMLESVGIKSNGFGRN